jgi:hypothetical protein
MTTDQNHKSIERYSLFNMVISFVVGEIAFVALPLLLQHTTDLPVLLQWLITVTLLTLGGYYLFGRPVVNKWEQGSVTAGSEIVTEDVRYRWGERLLERGGFISYVLGSALGGAPLISWYWCAHRKSHPYRATFFAAFIVATLGAALYTWLAVTLGTWLVLIVAAGILAVLIAATLYLNQGTKTEADQI